MSLRVPKVAPGVRCPSCGGPATYAPRESEHRYRCLRCYGTFGERARAVVAVGASPRREPWWLDRDEVRG